MSWPKHTNPTQPDRQAKAPYNFVPLPEKVLDAEALPTQDRYHAGRHTGWLDCTLTTATPMYVRCGVLPTVHPHCGSPSSSPLVYPSPSLSAWHSAVVHALPAAA